MELSGLGEDGQGLAAAMAAVEGWAGRGTLLFPEVCAMELLLLSAGSPELEVLRHVLRGLLGAVRSHPRNAALLYQQVRIATSTSYPSHYSSSVPFSGFILYFLLVKTPYLTLTPFSILLRPLLSFFYLAALIPVCKTTTVVLSPFHFFFFFNYVGVM